ncbi:hypothetical protein Tco_0174221 [Tanacetum coccineum]
MLNGLCMKERCKNAFDYVFEDPMVEIKNLKHVATVQFYQEQFEALMNKVELSEAYAISLFIGGSKDEIKEPMVQNFREIVIEAPLISLHPMTGQSTYKTMRVKAYVGKHTVHSLIDSRSTHTFLGLKIAKKLGYKLKAICPMDVSVANDHIISSLNEWVEWMSTLGDIKGNFKELVMDFVYNNKIMVLRGTQKATLQWMCGKKTNKEARSFKADHTCQSHHDVFTTPTSLLPKMKHDYKISLLPNTPPINIRPYKHPPNQKDVVEAMVKELMASGVIKDSQSPYSSPIVMVKKKDGTWRMCVDY